MCGSYVQFLLNMRNFVERFHFFFLFLRVYDIFRKNRNPRTIIFILNFSTIRVLNIVHYRYSEFLINFFISSCIRYFSKKLKSIIFYVIFEMISMIHVNIVIEYTLYVQRIFNKFF